MNSEKTYVFPPPCSVAHRTLMQTPIKQDKKWIYSIVLENQKWF